MELSVLRPVHTYTQAAAAPAITFGVLADAPMPAEPRVEDVEVRLPADLHHYGEATWVRAVGNPAHPAVVVLGGISGNRFVCSGRDGGAGWWSGLCGAGKAVDPTRFYVIGIDFAADPTGTAAPSTADQARVIAAMLDTLGIERATLIGASYGGMVSLAFAEAAPERVTRLVIISAGAEPHPAATASRELQRRVVALGLATGTGDEALAIARGMAMMTYRTAREFGERFDGGIDGSCPQTRSAPGSYLKARGEAFLSVMSPERFLSLSASIDRHKVDAATITAPALLIGTETDQLVFAEQMRSLAARLSGPAELRMLRCLYGHDMFLKEAEAIGELVAPFLASA